ncbi:MAG: AIR synthase-related protein, partial [Pseudomonadota bacterium]
MSYRLEVLAHIDDGRAKNVEKILESKGKKASVRVVDVYTSENDAINSETFIKSVTNPVTQKVNADYDHFDFALEIGFLPGVTDNVGHTAQELLALAGAENDNACYTSRLYLIKGDIKQNDVEALSHELANNLIQRIHIKSANEFANDNGMDIVIPKVTLDNKGAAADEVNLNVSDEELLVIGSSGIENSDGSRRGPLGLSLLYIQAIRDYFYETEGRAPKDIELETLAQTWSEHCKHTIFASPIDEIKDGIYKHYIKRATQDIRKAKGDKDICVSVFSDNAGAIIFNDDYLITDKVETHNSPSALDPFGGSITGIVGVNRDCIGFGMGAKPVINRYGYCLADPRKKFEYYRDKNKTISVLQPKTIMHGVVEGVEAGGNQSGIPTPAGFTYFDDRFVGKPLVFVGTIGLIPREINGKPSHVKKANPGDKIVMVGGRVGRDGIHGATFSSVALDEGSPATAVQIGDPITQKKLSDAIIKEIRDQGLYSAITDNGAGGLSSSVGEMAEQSGGFHVELDKVPLKYPGMAPWEIWISESQERITLAVPEENCEQLINHLAKRGSEATVIGTYTDTGRAHITWNDETIMDMEMDFLHDGIPETPLKTTFTKGGEPEPDIAEPSDYAETLCTMMSRLNIASKEFIATQYDHNVQGSAVLGPLQGKGRIYAEASVTKPILDAPQGVVLSQGLFPRYSDIDTYHMAASGLDMAVRNAVAAGADFEQLAILDNFCWCSSDEPERLGQLKRSAEAIYELATLYGTPFISGKDSMFNDFKGFDKDGKDVKISAPPTLLISSIGVIDHVDQAISLAPKAVGDVVYLLGETENELGASEYYDELGHLGSNVPEVHGKRNVMLYKMYNTAAKKRLISSSIAVGYGGLGVALAKKAIAGQMGLDIDLAALEKDLRADILLFSESQGRILVTVAPQNVKSFEKIFKKFHHVYKLGHV